MPTSRSTSARSRPETMATGHDRASRRTAGAHVVRQHRQLRARDDRRQRAVIVEKDGRPASPEQRLDVPWPQNPRAPPRARFRLDLDGGAELSEISDDDVRARPEQFLAMPGAVDSDDQAEPAGTPRGNAAQRILEHRRARRRDAQTLRGEEEGRGVRLALEPHPGGIVPIHDHVEQLRQLRPIQHGTGVAAGRDQPGLHPRAAQPADQVDAACEHLDAVRLENLPEERVLAIAEAAHRLAVGRVGGIAARQVDPARAQKGRDPVVSGQPVDVRAVIRFRELVEWLARALRPLAEIIVKQTLPRRRMHAGRAGHDAVQVEDRRIEPRQRCQAPLRDGRSLHPILHCQPGKAAHEVQRPPSFRHATRGGDQLSRERQQCAGRLPGFPKGPTPSMFRRDRDTGVLVLRSGPRLQMSRQAPR